MVTWMPRQQANGVREFIGQTSSAAVSGHQEEQARGIAACMDESHQHR